MSTGAPRAETPRTGAPRVAIVGEGPLAEAIVAALARLATHVVGSPPPAPVDAVAAAPPGHRVDRPGLALVTDVPVPPADPTLARADLVVEASPDAPFAHKAAIVAALLDVLPVRVPLVVATRLHTLDTLLPGVRHGARAVGLHLVDRAEGRALRGPLVAEVAMPAAFTDGVVDGVLDALDAAGLVALPCADRPGRIVDRLVATAALEARALVRAGLATPAELGTAIAGAGIDLGAVAEADLDTIAAAIHAGLGAPPRFAAPDRSGATAPLGRATPLEVDGIADRLELAVIAEAYRLVEEAVAGAEEIQRAMTEGAGWAAGPFTLGGRRGLRALVTALAALSRMPGTDPATADRFAIPRLLWQMATV